MQQDSTLIDSSHALTRRTRADACAEIAIRACGGPTKSSGQRVLREAPKWSVRICMHCNCRRGGIVYDFAQPITRTALFAFADGRDKERATFVIGSSCAHTRSSSYGSFHPDPIIVFVCKPVL